MITTADAPAVTPLAFDMMDWAQNVTDHMVRVIAFDAQQVQLTWEFHPHRLSKVRDLLCNLYKTRSTIHPGFLGGGYVTIAMAKRHWPGASRPGIFGILSTHKNWLSWISATTLRPIVG